MYYTVDRQFWEIIHEIQRLQRMDEKLLAIPIGRGKWSVREIVGHILYWDKFNLEIMVPRMGTGSILPAFPDHDLHNEEAMGYINRYGTIGEMFSAAIHMRRKLIRSLEQMDANTKFSIGNELGIFSLDRFVDIFVEHDSHHCRQIEQFMGEKPIAK